MRQTLLAILAATILATLPIGASAQVRPSVFADYESFEAFLDENVMKRQFAPLFQSLGQGGELSLADLQKLTESAKTAFPIDYEHAALIRRDTFENGFSQEARAYWTGERYAYVYVMLHQRDDGLVVTTIAMHAAIAPIMAMF